MQKSTAKCSSETQERRDSTVKAWLIRLSATFPRELPPEIFSVWIRALSDLRLETIEAAFAQIEKTFKPTSACTFPVPGHVRELVITANAGLLESEAETAWQKTMRVIAKHYCGADIGWDRHAAPLIGRVDHAARAAGGVPFLATCAEEELVWAKKRFIECYLRDENLPEWEQFGMPRELLQIVADIAKKKELK